MLCASSPAQRRFTIQMWIAAAACILFALIAAMAFRVGHVSGIFAYPVAVLPAVPILVSLVLTAAYLAEETDEFQRNLLVQSMLGGIGVTLTATTVSGYLEHFVHTPHLDSIFIFPIFWFSAAASYVVVQLRYR
jgi:hypothetical protein